MNRVLNWDDLHIVLAIATSGTLSGAGRSLNISHATVFRRLGQIEDRLGVKLFDRSRTGYNPTLAGEETAAAAQRIENEVIQVERRVIGRDLHPSGTVRITTTDTLFNGLMSPIFRKFRQCHRNINLEVIISNDLFDLTKREADIAIRPSSSPPEVLVGRMIGTIAQAAYQRKSDAMQSESGHDFKSDTWIGPDVSMAYRDLEQWMSKQGILESADYRINSLMGMYTAVRDGAGTAILPCYLADSDNSLARKSGIISELSSNLWLLTHPDLQMTARVRVLLDFIADAMTMHRHRIEGVT
jgi:DNA-binding transcriptional LysR family regulator